MSMTQFARLGSRRRAAGMLEEAHARHANDKNQQPPHEVSPLSGPISGLAEIPELGPRATPSEQKRGADHNSGIATPIARRRVADTELRVAPIALGTSVFGWTLSSQASTDILQRYRELGGNFIDTADSYSAGRSEHLIGTWMRQERCRDEIVLATKIGRNADFHGLGAAGIASAVEASLERLQTDRIDLLSFHYDDHDVELEESLGAVDALIQAGKVRYLAASNFSADRLLEARVLAANGLPRFSVMQAHYNLLHRSQYEQTLAFVAQGQGLAVMPYFALANGFLSGAYRSRNAIEPTTRGARVAAHLTRRGARVLGVMDRISEDYDVALPTIAIAWLQAKKHICAPVVGVSGAEQLDAVMAATDFTLSRSDTIDLDRASDGS